MWHKPEGQTINCINLLGYGGIIIISTILAKSRHYTSKINIKLNHSNHFNYNSTLQQIKCEHLEHSPKVPKK